MLLIIVGLLATACLPEPLEVEGIPKIKPQIVVSTQIVPDESLVVLLTRSFGALDASDDSDPQEVLDLIAINDAVVTITHGNDSDTLIFLGNGIYGGVLIDFIAGEDYTLYVNSASLGTVSSTTKVLPQVSFNEIEGHLFYDSFDDTLAEVSFTMTDPVGENWYLINVTKIEEDEIEERLLNPRTYSRLLDDTGIDGKTYGEMFQVFPQEFDSGDTIAVSLSNISKEYYDFVKLRQDNRFSLIEFLGEPVNYPSNVKGGRGFFNLYIPDIRFIVL